MFVQMATELAMKVFLIKNESLRVVLKDNYTNKSDEELVNLFHGDGLNTKAFWELKNIIITNYSPGLFDKDDIAHLDKFQTYRNKLVHFNLNLDESQLKELKFELTYVIVHVIIKFLAQINFKYESPSDFYKENLKQSTFRNLISYDPYVKEMSKMAKTYTGYAYECPECWKRAYSPFNNRCYCCGNDFTDMAEYVDCISCHAKNGVIFDPLNIGYNDNMINGLCLNCGEKMMVFKCPECETKTGFWVEEDLEDTCFGGCKH